MANILVVEDDADILELVTARLTSYGHEVRRCATPRQALAAVNQGYLPDLVCLDVGLPEMDGFYLSYRLRRHPRLNDRVVPTIFLSARADPEHVVEGRSMGATYITKPFSPTTLQIAIERALATTTSA